jgi:hypothetical protein
LRTQEPNIFEGIIFVDLSAETIKTQILVRREGAVYKELLIGKMAFELAKG